MKIAFALLVASSMLCAVAFAQAPQVKTSPSPAAPEPAAASAGYSYNPQVCDPSGKCLPRRDPFVSLLKPIQADQAKGPKRPGIEGFLVQEVSLKGIVKEAKGYIAMLLGPDGKSYFVKIGQKLYDGEVTAIDATSVTFRQQVTDPMLLPGQPRIRDVKKTLYPSEEAR
ncbi:MAG TPA: pilus assembly protein PilP [Vicinamibacteria bacterium]|jgi:hypothetical protein